MKLQVIYTCRYIYRSYPGLVVTDAPKQQRPSSVGHHREGGTGPGGHSGLLDALPLQEITFHVTGKLHLYNTRRGSAAPENLGWPSLTHASLTVNLLRSSAHMSSQTLPCSSSLSSSSATLRGEEMEHREMRRCIDVVPLSMGDYFYLSIISQREVASRGIGLKGLVCFQICAVYYSLTGRQIFEMRTPLFLLVSSPCCSLRTHTWYRRELRPGTRCEDSARPVPPSGGPGRST